MKTYLINHLRIPGDVPNSQGLTYLEKVEATVAPYGGKWLAQGSADVIEGVWPGSVVLMEFPTRRRDCLVQLGSISGDPVPSHQKRGLGPYHNRPDPGGIHGQGVCR